MLKIKLFLAHLFTCRKLHFQVKVKNEPLSDEAYDEGVVIDGSYPDNEVCMR